MPNIKKVEFTTKTINGLKIRTKNTAEINPDTQKIAPLWERFFEEIVPTVSTGTFMYGVYSNYESDASGEFDVLAGVEGLEEGEGMDSVTIEAGRYLKFSVKGEMPQAIIDAWGKIWVYFEDPSIDERRAYETDFEVYKSAYEAEIYIGVHYF